MPTRIKRWQKYKSQFSFLNNFIFSFSVSRLYGIRSDFATQYIKGEGYEIGAQNAPLYCKNASKIYYIDYLNRKESAQKYNIPEKECVEVDIIADANCLELLPSNSASFIIANHVLEHSPNPVGALLGWLRILKNDGILFLTLPNYKANEFDFERIPAHLSHLIEDYQKNKKNRDISSEHIYEHIRIIDGIQSGDRRLTEKRFEEIKASNLHTHYHVFDQKNSLELLQFVHQFSPLRVINMLSYDNSIELLYIISKCPSDNPGRLMVRQDTLLNGRILSVQLVKFLMKKLFSYWRRSGIEK